MSEQAIKLDGLKKKRGKPKGRVVDPVAKKEINTLLGNESRAADLLIEHLHKIQDLYGHISASHITALATEMKLSQTEVYEVATFYHHFDVVKENQSPPPPLTVRVCESLTCEMAGAHGLIDSLKHALGDQVRVQAVPCVGRCQHAPVAVVGQNPIDHAGKDAVGKADTGKATEAPVTDYITYEQYKTGGGYQLYQECVSGKRTPDELMSIMENSG